MKTEYVNFENVKNCPLTKEELKQKGARIV